MRKLEAEAVALLKKAGFEVKPEEGVFEIRREGMINPADVRAKISETLSFNGFQGYYLKEVYAFMGSKKPWRTDEEGYVEFAPWDSFSKLEEQKKVAKLNKIQVSPDVKITPLPTGHGG